MAKYTLQIRRNTTADYNLVIMCQDDQDDQDGPDPYIATVFLAADKQTLIDAVQEYPVESDSMSLGQWSGGPSGVSEIEAMDGGYTPNDYGELIAIRGNDGQYIEQDEDALAALILQLQD